MPSSESATFKFHRLRKKQAAEGFDFGLRLLRFEHDSSNRACAFHDVARNGCEKVTEVLEAELRHVALLSFDLFPENEVRCLFRLGPARGVQALHGTVDNSPEPFLELGLVDNLAIGDRFGELKGGGHKRDG
jgi:hypothetical protein